MKKHAAKKMDLNSLLKSRNVLYVVLFFAMANLFSYLLMKQLDAVAFFIIIGFLTTYFSKNMIVVMLTAMISTFLLVQIKLLGTVQEGNTGMEKKEDESDTKAEKEKKPTKEKVAAPPDPVSTSAIKIDRKKAVVPATSEKTEKFTQNLNPARYNSFDDDDTPRSHKPQVDYAATLETAYDNLDKLLSSDAIRNMAADTGRLAEKQQMLMGNIEKMTPIMEKAGNLLGNFDMDKISNLMGTVNKNLNTMGSGKSKF